VIATIFVNRLQFRPGEDFERYPRSFAADCEKLAAAGVEHLFAPDEAEMYPQAQSYHIEPPAAQAGILDGEFRPGHFRGVASVVAMLFNAVQADVAVFGRKDLQQLAVIRRMVRDLHFPVRIIAHETVREPNGVAMSSRNRYLSAEQLTQATAIPAAMEAAKALARTGVTDASRLQAAAQAVLSAQPALKPQYCEIVDLETMASVASTAGKSCAIAIACHLDATRLIDNADL
jgi:pantoate--beta-alanine ligase